MAFPLEPPFFPPRQAAGFFAAQGGLFLFDPVRLLEIAGTHVLGKDLLARTIGKPLGNELYREGALVPALGLEPGYYLVDIRSTATDLAPVPLTHIAFSTGFVLGTETGTLLLGNTDRMTAYTPGVPPPGRRALPVENVERAIEVSPGWYTVTVVAGLLDGAAGLPDEGEPGPVQAQDEYDFNQETGDWTDDTQPKGRRMTARRPRPMIKQEERWVCSFLLDPQPSRPAFTADLAKSLNLFAPEPVPPISE